SVDSARHRLERQGRGLLQDAEVALGDRPRPALVKGDVQVTGQMMSPRRRRRLFDRDEGSVQGGHPRRPRTRLAISGTTVDGNSTVLEHLPEPGEVGVVEQKRV